MASTSLGSKSDVFLLNGDKWVCSNGIEPDVVIQVEEISFHVHKFPLLSRSGFLEALFSKASETTSVVQLHDIPGGPHTFLLVLKFCYDVQIEITAENIAGLRCAAEYLQMSENHGQGNLISLTENSLNNEFKTWKDLMKILKRCEQMLPLAEQLHIIPKCITSLAIKVCEEEEEEDTTLFNWPVWNGIPTPGKSPRSSDNWWLDDASSLDFSIYKRFIKNVQSKGMKEHQIVASITHYAKHNLPLLGSSRDSTYTHIHSPLHERQTALLEEIVELLPTRTQNSVISTNFLLRLLRTSMVLHVSPLCQEILEKKIGEQLNQAALEDLLIPNMSYSGETLYDIDCTHRILDHFMLMDSSSSPHLGTPISKVASLIDGYLVEVACDENLKVSKFQALCSTIPEDVRIMDDGIYRAIDTYLKAHPWLRESEREQLCHLINCEKLSLEACKHAAQNERLPLRFIVQILFLEQMRLRATILENREIGAQEDMNEIRERVYDLERECMSMKCDLNKLLKTKQEGNMMNIFSKIFGMKFKMSQCCQNKK